MVPVGGHASRVHSTCFRWHGRAASRSRDLNLGLQGCATWELGMALVNGCIFCVHGTCILDGIGKRWLPGTCILVSMNVWLGSLSAVVYPMCTVLAS